MPQLWLTYAELAGELECDADQARAASISAGWKRKHSSDGFTRVMMPAHLMAGFFIKAASREAPSAAMVGPVRCASMPTVPAARRA